MPIRVAGIEDHPLMLKVIVHELDAQDDIQVVGMALHGSELPRLVRETSPDVVVLDLGMSKGAFEPVVSVETVLEAHPNVGILVLTGYEDTVWMRELIDAGVQGYVLKSDNLSLYLPEAVRRIYRGGRFYSPAVTDKYFAYENTAALTDQELAILRLAAQALSNVQIGYEMGLAEKTVRNYLSRIYGKLGVQAEEDVNPRVAAINRARDWGLLREERH